jgi:hypothetical protein
MDRMRTFAWKHVREVMLSVDRGKFHDAEDCNRKISSWRGIGEFIKNLARTDGVKIVDWIAFKEWHRDGFPHWHILIETEDEGREGMIGAKRIRERWPHGIWVTEKFIESQEHWNNLVGYFDRHGYFEKGKGYQGKLPEWAMKSTHKKMKRWISKRGGDQEAIRLMRMDWNAQDEKLENFSMIQGMIHEEKQLSKDKKLSAREEKNYEQILASCGMRTRIVIRNNSLDDSFKVDIPYSEIKSGWEWTYKEGKGLTMSLSKSEKEAFVSRLVDMSRGVRGGEQLEGKPDLRAAPGIARGTGAITGTGNLRSLEANLTDSVRDSEHEGEGTKGQIDRS